MNPVELIRSQMTLAHEWLESTMTDVTPEIAHANPGGTAHPIGARYAHAVVGEDMLVNAVLRKALPVHASVPAGIADPQSAFHVTLEWASSVEVDLAALHAYAEEVYAATDAYLAGLSPADLDSIVDLSDLGFGSWPLGAFILTFLFGHLHDIMGEIAAVKGIMGLKGFPF